jgi:hypothetical protein
VTNKYARRAWKHPNGTITRFSASGQVDYSTLSIGIFPPGTREIEVGGPEDVDPPASCDHGECWEKYSKAVAEVHVQGSWDSSGEEPGWYHMFMCAEHFTGGFVKYRCNCPGTDTAHEHCNCPFCKHGEDPGRIPRDLPPGLMELSLDFPPDESDDF